MYYPLCPAYSCYSSHTKREVSDMDVNTIAPIMGIIFITLALALFTISVLSLLDWYGMISVSWINVDRKSRPKDTNPHNE